MTDDELIRLFASMREENAAAHVETRRQFDVSTEATKHEIQLVAESVGHLSEALERTRIALEEGLERTARDT